MEANVKVFLAVIAATAILQAGFIVVLALAVRRLDARLEEMESRYDRDLHPALDRLSAAARSAAQASETILAQAQRVDRATADAAVRAERLMVSTRIKLTGGVDSALQALGHRVVRRTRLARLPLAEARAVLQGVRRAMAVWHGNGHDRAH